MLSLRSLFRHLPPDKIETDRNVRILYRDFFNLNMQPKVTSNNTDISSKFLRLQLREMKKDVRAVNLQEEESNPIYHSDECLAKQHDEKAIYEWEDFFVD